MADKIVKEEKPLQFSNSIVNQFKQFFGIGVNRSATDISDKVFPTNIHNKDIDDKFDTKRVKLDDEAKQAYEWWLKETHISTQRYKERQNMFDDLDILYSNCGLVSKAAAIIEGEMIQADSNNQVIFIDAKRPVKKFIQEFFDKINLSYHIKTIIKDYVKYGNTGILLDFDDEGVSEIIPITPRSIRERLEFNASEVVRMIKDKNSFITDYRKLDRVEQYIQSIVSKETSTSFYKSYLLGYQIDDRIVPPWKFLHFRNMSNDDPFKDFGIPVFVNTMSPYRQYDAAMSLQISARSARFPKHIFTLNLPNTMGATEKLEQALEFMNEYMNSGMGTSRKEMPGVGDTMVTIEGLFDYKQIVPEIDLGKMDDIEMLRQDLLNSIPVPRNLIDPNDTAFGDSGISLVEKFKPFARMIFNWQTSILEQLTMLVKIHMICSGKFSVNDVKFTLSMPYPESQTNRDIIDSQSALLALANDVIQNLQDKIVGGDSLPPEIIRQVYTKFLPYDDEVVNQWIDDSIKAKEEAQEQQDEFNSDETFDQEMDFTDEENSIDDIGSEVDDIIDTTNEIVQENILKRIRRKWRLVEKAVGRHKLQEQIENELFEGIYDNITEGVVCNRHMYSSRNSHPDFKPEHLREYDRKQLLKEDEDYLEKFSEELEYVFDKNSEV